jgi:ribosome-binding protein aMBF1 (putative translation factor)
MWSLTDSTEEKKIKKRIRARDKYRCVVCNMAYGTHEKRFGRDFEVHRIGPGSQYSTKIGVCVTLCVVCHDAMHEQGSWGWVTKDRWEDEEDKIRLIKRSIRHDSNDEKAWRQREAWGDQLRNFRKTIGISEAALARRLEIPDVGEKTIRNWEAGRSEPKLSEARPLAVALKITLDELAQQQPPGDAWMALAKHQSEARAFVFCQYGVAPVETLNAGASLISKVVKQAINKCRE